MINIFLFLRWKELSDFNFGYDFCELWLCKSFGESVFELVFYGDMCEI